MREMLDCGVLAPPGHEEAMRAWIARHQSQSARVRFYPLSLSPTGADVAPCALANMAVVLKRYDACLMPVAQATLAWTRIALQQARPMLATPILVLVDGMKASAIEDLLTLGAADFISEPVCLEGLRARLRRHLLVSAGGPGPVPLEEPSAFYAGHLLRQAADHGPAYCAESGGRSAQVDAWPHSVRHPGRYSRAGPSGSPSPRMPLRPRAMPVSFDQTLSSLRLMPERRQDQEPFGTAKARVVGDFEREYLRRALSRHSGNVAQAARASCKHRRAFWALMRKHGIDAASYRLAAARRGEDEPSD